ncbi:MAG: hypothetical protein IKS92_12235 [Victivallales bacterium]|nr:hypothetical protein [Victivallales bacterium]
MALNIKQKHGINSNYGRQSKRSCGLPIRMIGVNFNSAKGAHRRLEGDSTAMM